MDSSVIRKLFIGIVILVTILRLGVVGYMMHTHKEVASIQDAHEYLQLAHNLLEHHVFSQSTHAPYSAELLRTPLYPLFISATLPFDSRGYLAIALQQLLAIAGGILLFLIFARLGLQKIGLIFATLWIIEPLTWFNSLVLLSEALFSFFALLLLYVLIGSKMEHGIEQMNIRQTAMQAVLAGMLLGLMILTRPVGIVWIPPVFLFLVLQTKRNVLIPAIMLAACFVTLSPWLIRNYTIVRAPVISSSSPFNLILGFGSDAERSIVLQPIERTLDQQGRTMLYMYGYSAEAYTEMKTFQHDIIARLGYPYLIERNLMCGAPVWLGGGYALLGAFVGIPITSPPLVGGIELIGKCFWIFICLLALAGTIHLLRRRQYALASLLVGIILFSTFINYCEAYERMRIPLIPAVFLLASFGLGGCGPRRHIL